MDFLVGFSTEADIQGVTDAREFITLPSFRGGLALIKFESPVGIISPTEGGISSWPEAVQYLLRSYDQSTHVSVAIKDLRKTQQKQDEEQ